MSEQQSRLSVVISTEQAKRNAEALNKSLAEMNKKGDDAAKSATNVGKSADGAKSGLKSHKGAVDDVAKSYSNWSSLTKTTIAGVIAGIGKSAIDVAAFATMATLIAKTGKEMQAMAYQSNSTAEELQGFVFAAKKVNDTFNMDKVGDVFKDVNDKIGDYLTEGGGELKQFFEEIAPKVGVTAEQFRNLSGPQALQLYVSTLEKAGLSQTEMVTHMERIANDATGLLPILQDNGKAWKELAESAQDAGLIMSNDAAASAAELDNKISMLSDSIIIMRNYFAEEIIPIINSFIDNMTLSSDGTNTLHQDVNEFAQDGSFKQWFIGVGYAIAGVIDVARLAGQIVDALGKTIAYVMVQGSRFNAWTDSLNPFGAKSDDFVANAKSELNALTGAANEAKKEMSIAMNKKFEFTAIDSWEKAANAGDKAAKTQQQLAGLADKTHKSIAQQGWEQAKAAKEAEKAARAKEREAKAAKVVEAAYLSPYSNKFTAGSPMGDRFHPIQKKWKFHAGRDVPMPVGSDLKAMTSGVVDSVGRRGGYGNTITIKHDDGTKAMYAHLSTALLKAGERVQAGQVVAKSGNTGDSTGPHAHIEFWDKQGQRREVTKVIGKKTINKVGEASKSNYLELTEQEKDLALEYNVAMQERMIMLGKETELQKLNAEIELGKYESVEPERIKQMQQMAEQYDSAVKVNEQQERMNALIEDATGSEAVKSYYQDWDMLTQAFKEGKINAEQYTLALAKLNESKPDALKTDFEKNWGSTKQWIDDANDVQARLDQGMAGWLQSSSDALAEFVATGKMNFRDLTVSILQDLAKIAMQKAIAGIAGSLFGYGGSSAAAGAGSTALDSLFATGGAFGQGGVRYFAQGGTFTNSVVDKPTMFKSGGMLGVMGEAGPEAILPLKRTSSGNLGVETTGAGAAGQPVVYITNHITVESSGDSEKDGAAIADGINKQLISTIDGRINVKIDNELRHNGKISNAIKGR
ncbi:peptidoglycan DD-metalloendopeptidase family protein [Vitreoscilla massiliensis]|nr:peptidoglycan DD-metalloendopeptidase family protein [Vitreoscilla massiliensis]